VLLEAKNLNEQSKPVLSQLIFKGLLLTLLGLAGCDSFPGIQFRGLRVTVGQPQITPIATLDQQKEANSWVYVQGTVRDRAPLIKQTVYQLQDQTGKVWVMTTKLPPESGQTVTIQAKIKSKSIVLHQQQSQELYLKEVRQLPQSLK